MAVFTPIKRARIAPFLRRHYGISQIGGMLPISEGIENTNYKLTADGAARILTVFEVWDADRVEYYAALMRHLAACGLPVPAPLESADGKAPQWRNKPLLLVPFADGESKMSPTAAECRRIGELLAKLHLATASFSRRRDNPRNATWRREAAKQLGAVVPAATQKLLDEEILRDAQFSRAPLPMTACHCDLFRNNVLWEKNRVAAIIDFYFGGEESLIYDLAVCVCDWCCDDDGRAFDEERRRELLAGYEQERRLCELEQEMLPDAFCIAALRFWLSRLYDLHFPRRAETLRAHDPARFENILRACREQAPAVSATATVS